MIKIDDDIDYEKELWDLALNTPMKHYWIYISNKELGIDFKVDQSLDSHITGSQLAMKQLLDMMWGAREQFKSKSYEEIFGEKEITELKINGFTIRFEGVKGKNAYTLLMRYFNNLLNQLVANKSIKIKTGSEGVIDG